MVTNTRAVLLRTFTGISYNSDSIISIRLPGGPEREIIDCSPCTAAARSRAPKVPCFVLQVRRSDSCITLTQTQEAPDR